MTEITKKPRGFATLSPEDLHAICSKGGKAAHAQGKAHSFSSDEAQAAGKKGGATVSRDRAHMAEIGRRGGRARGEKARVKAARAAVNPQFPTKIEMPPGGEETVY